jgi:hypothetical protein
MTFAERLAVRGLYVPEYGQRELGAVLPAALAAVGAAGAITTRDAEADRVRLGIPFAKHVVVVLLDGLGHWQLDARRGHAPFLRSIEQGIVTAGYPTTTATSLGLFGTGQPAGQTGMMGYTVRNPATGTLANMVSWEGAPPPAEWQPCESLLSLAAGRGLSITTLGKARFAGSGLTQAVLSGGDFVGAESLAERIELSAKAAREPGFTYCYWGEIDAAGHKFGWASDPWVAALEDADRELRRLAALLPPGAELVITADHGMVDVTGAPRWDVAEHAVLREGVELIAGEPRALHVHLTDPGTAERTAARWQDYLGEHAAVATQQEAIATGLFGQVDEAMRVRVGDVVVAMAGRATVVDSRTQTAQSLNLIGVHGSLTPEELQVPLLVASGRG